MRKDSKLSGVLHILLHMAEANGPVTSESMAKMMQTNPVVIRRILAGLREQGFVMSEKGHGGGWQLSCDLNTVTLYDVYAALEAPTILAIGNRSESPNCLVEEAVNTLMNEAFRAAEALLLARFREVTLAQLSQHVHQRLQERGACHGQNVNVAELLAICESEGRNAVTPEMTHDQAEGNAAGSGFQHDVAE